MSHVLHGARLTRVPRGVLVGALVLGILAGLFMPRLMANAQDTEARTYTAFAGGAAGFNTVILAFAPQNLQVHRGDTVTWLRSGFHNIHFEDGLANLIIAPEVGGIPLPQVNPAIAFPSIENGGVFQGGDANSGLPIDPSASVAFSLVMDVDPGVYAYYCDVHPGMAGSIEVTDASTAISSPEEAIAAGANELAASGNLAVATAFQASVAAPVTGDDGSLQVGAGIQEGASAVLAFFPSVVVVGAGQSVTWTVPPGLEPHTITSPPQTPGSDLEIIPQEGGPPIIALSEVAFPSLESGATVAGGDTFNTGILPPGQSFTLTFSEPGVYNYSCTLHAGMTGSVVVTAPAH